MGSDASLSQESDDATLRLEDLGGNVGAARTNWRRADIDVCRR
jgi:hypothetical protein